MSRTVLLRSATNNHQVRDRNTNARRQQYPRTPPRPAHPQRPKDREEDRREQKQAATVQIIRPAWKRVREILIVEILGNVVHADYAVARGIYNKRGSHRLIAQTVLCDLTKPRDVVPAQARHGG